MKPFISACYNKLKTDTSRRDFLPPRLITSDWPLLWWQAFSLWCCRCFSTQWIQICVAVTHTDKYPSSSLLFLSFPLGFQNLEFYILSSTILSYFTLLFPWKVLLMLSKHTLLYVSNVSLTFLKYFEQNLLRQLILSHFT